jgi:hypothetical protein
MEKTMRDMVGRRAGTLTRCAVLVATLTMGVRAEAVTRQVVPGESIQATIDASTDGDVVELGAGAWVEDVDFRGKAIVVVGRGPDTVLHGTGAGPVVTFASGEAADSVLDSVTVTGGIAERGGGVRIDGASPTLLRNCILRNRAHRQGSGIYLGASHAVLRNNLVADNATGSLFAGDAHGVEIVGGAPTLRNNTIVDGDSNGIIVRAGAAAVIDGNVLAHNGSQTGGGARGRGICDFSGGAAVIRHNLFWSNRRGALLTTGGTNYGRIAVAERRIAADRVSGNRDGSPRFRSRRGLDYRPGVGSRAIDLGDPSPELRDRDGTRNDAGYTGGPLAPAW